MDLHCLPVICRGTMLVHRKLLNKSMTYRARRTTIENRAPQYD